jgi:hypothetical protein
MVKLKPKHYKALELFEEGLLNIKEIAAACDIPTRSMYELFEGNQEKQGQLAVLFKEELARITQRTTAKIKEMTKDTKKLAIYQLNARLRELNARKKKTVVETKEICSIMNSLAKVTPQVDTMNISMTKGMTAEELVNEFKRLTALARYASIRKRIPRIEQGESG